MAGSKYTVIITVAERIQDQWKPTVVRAPSPSAEYSYDAETARCKSQDSLHSQFKHN